MPDPQPITEDWLKSVGFKWSEVSTNPHEAKHWTLWFGGVANDEPDQIWRFHDDEDLGIELSPGAGVRSERWFCWLRADISHRYSRFLHIRHIRFQHELIQIVEALSGVAWAEENHLYGKIFTPEQARRILERDQRLDVRIAKSSPWSKAEQDGSKDFRSPEKDPGGDA